METANKRRALGRGLEELFNTEVIDFNKLEERIYEQSTKEEIIDIPLNELRSNPYQPRKEFNRESLEELAESIREYGVFQPIIVKKSIKGYDIIAGERRTRAAKLAGLDKIPAIVRNFTDNQMMEIALLENLQRENLNAIEEAQAYENLLSNLGITQEELAHKLGKSRSHITNMLGLLSLPNEVKDMVSNSKITMGHARVLSKLEDPIKIKELAMKVYSEHLSVRDIEKLAEDRDIKRKNQIIKRNNSTEYNDLEHQLTNKLGTKVKINHNKIEISFVNTNDLNRIIDLIGMDFDE